MAIDLFGPVEYQQHVKKRQVGKGWGVVFVCTTTSALHVEFMDTYSTDSFLMALRMSVRGTPTRFQSDRGEQLVAAAKQVSTWDFKEVVQWAGRKGIELYSSSDVRSCVGNTYPYREPIPVHQAKYI